MTEAFLIWFPLFILNAISQESDIFTSEEIRNWEENIIKGEEIGNKNMKEKVANLKFCCERFIDSRWYKNF